MGTLFLLAGKVLVPFVAVAIPWLGLTRVEHNFAADPRPARAIPEGEHAVAIPIPGKPGFCFNPFTNNPMDVRGIPPGTLVRDPADPDPTHIFRVP